MAVIKFSKKNELDQLIASLTLRLGKKIPQQDIIDACIDLSIRHINELENHFSPKKKMSKKRIQEILTMAEDIDHDTTKTIDDDIYGG
ncbi:MAG: hypothetical protein GY870_02855 [archaeon]|nr:hypothetical protein [archaeon]